MTKLSSMLISPVGTELLSEKKIAIRYEPLDVLTVMTMLTSGDTNLFSAANAITSLTLELIFRNFAPLEIRKDNGYRNSS